MASCKAEASLRGSGEGGAAEVRDDAVRVGVDGAGVVLGEGDVPGAGDVLGEEDVSAPVRPPGRTRPHRTAPAVPRAAVTAPAPISTERREPRACGPAR